MAEMRINIDPSVKPIFADDVFVSCTIKQEKDKEGKINKEGKVELLFIEAVGQRALTKIVLSKITAKALAGILQRNTENLEKELAKKGEIKQPVSMQDTSEKGVYIG